MKPLKILHVIGQRPEMTGSGIYLEALIRESKKFGLSNYRIAGVPAGPPREVVIPAAARRIIGGT